MTNADLVARGIDTGRMGRRAHRHPPAPPGCAGGHPSELAYEASVRAIAAAGHRTLRHRPDHRRHLDARITSFPSTAALLQARLGITNGGRPFDLQAVHRFRMRCPATAEKFIRSGSHKRALVVGRRSSRASSTGTIAPPCVLFGDGAGAVVLAAQRAAGILATALHADGSHNPILSCAGSDQSR